MFLKLTIAKESTGEGDPNPAYLSRKMLKKLRSDVIGKPVTVTAGNSSVVGQILDAEIVDGALVVDAVITDLEPVKHIELVYGTQTGS